MKALKQPGKTFFTSLLGEGQDFGFVRVAAASPELRVADVHFNEVKIQAAMDTAAVQGATIVVFPELALTGYSCGDLFAQSQLLMGAKDALVRLARYTNNLPIIAVLGIPINIEGRLFNCAAVLAGGKLIGLVPKQYLPSMGEFYEGRWFASGDKVGFQSVPFDAYAVPVSCRLLFAHGLMTFAIEICEDLWAPQPPSGEMAVAGANVILNLSASNELLGKADYRRDLVRLQSARCLAAYVYASAGPGESSTDMVFSGHCLVAENGVLLAQSERFRFETQIVLADIDLERLQHDRQVSSSYRASPIDDGAYAVHIDSIAPIIGASNKLGTLRPNSPWPFVPADPDMRAASCREVFSIQATGLAKRLKHTGVTKVVIGLSGGLDSTLALLVAANAFDQLRLDRKGILAPTLPGPGTTSRTRSNAEKLAKEIGAKFWEIPIREAVAQHFKDIEHDEGCHDVTYENAQARERTQILMDIANKHAALVVGTGDLSEAALGWCTFNGDHMSMYHINSGVPKTLVKYVVDWCADHGFSGSAAAVLHDICATPITPELLPLRDDGSLQQKTEDVVGPFELHDYFLYQIARYGYRPAKVLCLAEMAFAKKYDRKDILKWLEIFIRRFFSQQFKRSAMPDGPKVGSVALSPRGDWRMPSDASPALWLAEVQRLVQ